MDLVWLGLECNNVKCTGQVVFVHGCINSNGVTLNLKQSLLMGAFLCLCFGMISATGE